MSKQSKQQFPNPLDNVLRTGKVGGLPNSDKPKPEDQSPTPPPKQETQPAPENKEPDNLKTLKPSEKPAKEKATVQISTYFTPSLYLKLKRFETEILERTGKKTDPNKIIRQLAEKASIEDILPLYEK